MQVCFSEFKSFVHLGMTTWSPYKYKSVDFYANVSITNIIIWFTLYLK